MLPRPFQAAIASVGVTQHLAGTDGAATCTGCQATLSGGALSHVPGCSEILAMALALSGVNSTGPAGN